MSHIVDISGADYVLLLRVEYLCKVHLPEEFVMQFILFFYKKNTKCNDISELVKKKYICERFQNSGRILIHLRY